MANTPPRSIVAAVGIPEADPIFEAIERHRAAYSRLLSALFVLGPLLPGEDGEQAAQAAAEEAKSEADKNGMALTTTQPTSLGGVIALLRYVESFNAGQIRSPDNADHSELESWPRISDDDNTEGAAFVCAVMSNIRRALTAAKSSNPATLEAEFHPYPKVDDRSAAH
jgi:hypothetical protein